jgi:hypothetical protein
MCSSRNPESSDLEAMVAKLGELAAEIAAAPAEDVAPQLVRAEQAVLEASQCVAAVVLTDRNDAELVRAAIQALADASHAVQQLRQHRR